MFPFPSLYVHVTTVVPWVVIGNVVPVVPVIVPAQLSFAVGGVSDVTEHCAVIFGKVATFGTGGVVSSISIVCVCVDVFPFPSL